jgi:uncharacterized protein
MLLHLYAHICILLVGVRYTWDEEKAEQVLKEHGISFAQIIDIFSDPYAVEYVDEAHSTETEIRYAIIGLTGYGLTYLVFTDVNEEEVHFITTRLAEPWMVDDYEENKRRI